MDINLTLPGQIIAFAVFVWFCMKYVWPPITTAMAERAQKIADGLDAANRASKDLELAQDKATEQLREAKTQAAEIIEQANKRSNQIVEEAKTKAMEEGDRIKQAAEAEIDQERNRAKEELRKQVAALAVSGAEKVLQREINADAHRDLVDSLATQL